MKAPGKPSTHVALLRGINVGKAKRVAMADLRALVTKLGYGAARTLLNSGNVVFDVPPGATGTPATRIEQALVRDLGVSSRVVVLSAAELRTAVAGNPLARKDRDPARLQVSVPLRAADIALLRPLATRRWSPGALAIGRRVAYLWCPDGVLASAALEAVSEALDDAVTTRNMATMTKLLALIDGP